MKGFFGIQVSLYSNVDDTHKMWRLPKLEQWWFCFIIMYLVTWRDVMIVYSRAFKIKKQRLKRTGPCERSAARLPCALRPAADALVQIEVLLRRAGGQGGLHVVGQRGLEGEQGRLAGVRRGRGFPLSEKVLAAAAELCWRGARPVRGRGDVPQGVCEQRARAVWGDGEGKAALSRTGRAEDEGLWGAEATPRSGSVLSACPPAALPYCPLPAQDLRAAPGVARSPPAPLREARLLRVQALGEANLGKANATASPLSGGSWGIASLKATLALLNEALLPEDSGSKGPGPRHCTTW